MEVIDLRLGLFFLLILVANSVCDALDLPSSNLSGDANTGEKIDVCALCEQYTSMALNYLAKNKTQKEVILLLHLACSKLHPFQKQCVTVVDYYAPLFFSHLSLEDADDFCKKVDVCGKHKFSSLLVKEDKCDLCHYVVDEVKIKLKDPDAKLEIIELLLKACDAVENYLKKAEFIFHIYLFIYKSRGTDLVDKVNLEEVYYFHHDQILNHKDYNGTCSLKCKTLVFEYGPLILTNAEKFLENTDICNTLHACSSTIAETTSENLPNDKILMIARETTYMKIEITSSETIRPSAPTPDHLRSYRFSFLDQLSPVLYGPLIFFYPKIDGDDPSHFLPGLKQALSETLVKFYPLAGRIKDNFSVDCNDEGVLYMEARADLPLQEFLKEPRVESLGRFLPRKTTCEEPLTEAIQVTVQVTKFECGGMAIGTCFLHKIVDGASAYNFLNSWAASARSALGHDAKAMVSPDFTTAPSLFPAKDMLASHMTYVRIDAGIVVVMKRFLLDASAVSTIKERARGKNVANPSRVEALSAFIWKHVVLASHEVNSSGGKTSMFIHSVNFRSRGIPPLPQGSIGNLYSLAPAQCDQIEEYDEPSVLVSKIREAIKKVNADSVKALQTEEGFMKNFKALASNPAFKSAKKYWCTSWLRLGFTEVDFGWGKPIWICPSFDTKTSLHKNQIIFIDEENGGVEVWMVLDQREMDALERDQEFLAFATPRS